MGEHRETSGRLAEELEIGSIDPAEIVRTAEEIAREHPHASLAGAFAVGFLLGGGLTPRLLTSLVLFAGRRYAAEAAKQVLELAVRREGEGPEGEVPAGFGRP
jgi:hypothetical protein